LKKRYYNIIILNFEANFVKKIIIYLNFLLTGFLLSGCLFFNERGVSSTYYNECTHYYDSRGLYREDCDKNIVDYKDLNPVETNGNGIYYINF
jgi:hypothetical protein